MKLFDRYIGRQILAGALIGITILSVIFVLGNLYKKLDKIFGQADLPFSTVLEFMGYVLPYSLIFTIPWALLTAVLLTFGRLSADNELISMRMAGITMPRLCLPVFFIAAALSGVCYLANVSLAPESEAKMRRLIYEIAVKDPSTLFQEGRVLEKIPGYKIYTEKRVGDDLTNLQIIEMDKTRSKAMIVAAKAKVITSGRDDLRLEMTGFMREDASWKQNSTPLNFSATSAEATTMDFPLAELREKAQRVSLSMKTTHVLEDELRQGKDSRSGETLDRKKGSGILTEINKRYSCSLACLTLALIGIPLGITAQRRETSAGFAISLGVAVVYFLFIIIAGKFSEKPGSYPHLLMWLPNVIFGGIGLILFYRLSRR